jgi:lipopolysaccharide export system protein LptA
VTVYSGNARLWQDANIVEAATIEFDRGHRAVVAHGSPSQRISTVVVQVDNRGKATPIAITSSQLTYKDAERTAHFAGGVVAKGADVTMGASEMDVFLQSRGETAGTQALGGAGRLEKIVAQGAVVVSQPTRQASGEKLVYTADQNKFVLTGGSPSIFDAEHGKITGVSLTFFGHDDRVLVEGNGTQPTVTQTRVAR